MAELFYAHGKTFTDEESFFKFCKEWPDMPVDLEEFEHQLRLRLEEVTVNNKIRNGTLTNKEAYQILRLSTDWAGSFGDWEKNNE